MAFEILRNILAVSDQKKDVSEKILKIYDISNLLRYIDDHLSEELSREMLAHKYSLSPTRFHYVFKEATGIAPMQYVNMRRLDKARMMLLTTNDSISEIALQTGYRDFFYFSKIFKQKFGISPLNYRKSYVL